MGIRWLTGDQILYQPQWSNQVSLLISKIPKGAVSIDLNPWDSTLSIRAEAQVCYLC